MQFRCEMFGHLAYDESLSFEALLAEENRLLPLFQSILEDAGASHIDFSPQGDGLRMHCTFAQPDLGAQRHLCACMALNINAGVLGRIVFVDREMKSLLFYGMSHKKWREVDLALPDLVQLLAGTPKKSQKRKEKAKKETPAKKEARTQVPKPAKAKKSSEKGKPKVNA